MTCIVGYLDKKTKKVTIGGDSAGVAGLDITIRKDEKTKDTLLNRIDVKKINEAVLTQLSKS